MYSKEKSIVIIDDYPLHIQVYQNILKDIESFDNRWSFKVYEAKSGDEALGLLAEMELASQPIDLVLLDLNIPHSKRRSHFNGEAIGLEIRSRFAAAKIIINAESKNNYQINTILRSIKPEGFLIMTDVDIEVVRSAIIDVLKNIQFFSKSALRSLSKSKGHSIPLDKWDEKLLYELSLGAKMKDLPEILPFSLAGIEKRKRNLKLLFGIEGQDNRLLLERAREYGLI